jgi:hypothetical protein
VKNFAENAWMPASLFVFTFLTAPSGSLMFKGAYAKTPSLLDMRSLAFSRKETRLLKRKVLYEEGPMLLRETPLLEN